MRLHWRTVLQGFTADRVLLPESVVGTLESDHWTRKVFAAGTEYEVAVEKAVEKAKTAQSESSCSSHALAVCIISGRKPHVEVRNNV